MKWMILYISPIAAISMKNWIIMWVFLEFSSMSFILLSKNKSSSESLLKYFLIQTFGSVFIILSISLETHSSMKMNLPSFSFSSMIIVFSLIMKAGLVPIHFWMIQICKKLKSTNILLFLTIQKLAPIMILLMTSNMFIFSFLMFLNSLIGTMSQMYSLNLNMLLTFSSISHSSWILLSGMNSKEMLIIYFSVYTLILTQILKNLKKTKTLNISEMEKNNNNIIMFMSLSGLPPLLGFFPKWMALSFSLEKSNIKLMCLFMTIMACLNIFIYLRIFSLLIFKTPKSFTKKKKTNKISLETATQIIPSMLFFSPKS